jgi:hypothetical protein
VLDEQHVFPEKINLAEIAGRFENGHFKGSDGFSRETEDGEELVPERLFIGTFARGAAPVAGKFNGVVTDFVP